MKKLLIMVTLSLASATAMAEITTNGHGNIDLQISRTKHNDHNAITNYGFNSKLKINHENGFTLDFPIKWMVSSKDRYQQGGINAGYRFGSDKFNVNPYAGIGFKTGKHKFDGEHKLKQRRAYAEVGTSAELHLTENFFIQPNLSYQHDFYNKSKIDSESDKKKGHAINTELGFNIKVAESDNNNSKIYLRIAPFYDYYTNKTDLIGGAKHKYRETGVRVGLSF